MEKSKVVETITGQDQVTITDQDQVTITGQDQVTIIDKVVETITDQGQTTITDKSKAAITEKDREMTESLVIKIKEEKVKAKRKFGTHLAETESLPERQKGFARTTNE
jgi:hypothetical protein